MIQFNKLQWTIAIVSCALLGLTHVAADSGVLAILVVAQVLCGIWQISNRLSPVLLNILGVSEALLKSIATGVYFWPLTLLIPILAASLFWWRFRPTAEWQLRLGTVRSHLPLVAGVAALGIFGLAAWCISFELELRQQRELIPSVSWPIASLIVLAFALTNAGMEEIIYREFVQSALASARVMSVQTVNVAQACVFGLAHYAGGFRTALSASRLLQYLDCS